MRKPTVRFRSVAWKWDWGRRSRGCSAEAGGGSVKFIEWPEEKRKIDIGSFYSDSSKFTAATGWTPTIALREGFRRTCEFYRAHFDKYLDAPREAAVR